MAENREEFLESQWEYAYMAIQDKLGKEKVGAFCHFLTAYYSLHKQSCVIRRGNHSFYRLYQ